MPAIGGQGDQNGTAEHAFDLVVVGSGAGGLSAAVVAAKSGLSVLVVEKSEYFGGTTAYSGGMAWIPNNHYMPAAGVQDSRDQALTYLRNAQGNRYDPQKSEAFVDNAPRMLRFMEENTSLAFTPSALPDYEPSLEGATSHRGVVAREFDGTALGTRLGSLRTPRPELVLFGSMQVAGTDVHPLRNAFRTLAGFRHAFRMFTAFAWQKLLHRRGTRLVAGNALAARLLHTAGNLGVTLWNKTRALELIGTGSRITGVRVLRDGHKISIVARRAVVLATGGFGANEEMRATYIPQSKHHVTLQPNENIGDGIAMGVNAGGRLVDDNLANAIYTPVSFLRSADAVLKFPHIMIDRYMPGSIIVNASGQRFVNEGTHYQELVGRMHELGLTEVFLVGDHKFLRTYGMGLVRPFPYPIGKWNRNGYLLSAPTLAALADKMGVPAQALTETVRHFNRHAGKGHDPDFRRGDDRYSRFKGDPAHGPNTGLAPLVSAPFHAIRMVAGDLGTVAGLDTDEKSRVLGADHKPIGGLYAVGIDMNSMTHGLYPAGGTSLGAALTFGYIAARDIAGTNSA